MLSHARRLVPSSRNRSPELFCHRNSERVAGSSRPQCLVRPLKYPSGSVSSSVPERIALTKAL
jgi:hypothetical protein